MCCDWVQRFVGPLLTDCSKSHQLHSKKHPIRRAQQARCSLVAILQLLVAEEPPLLPFPYACTPEPETRNIWLPKGNRCRAPRFRAVQWRAKFALRAAVRAARLLVRPAAVHPTSQSIRHSLRGVISVIDDGARNQSFSPPRPQCFSFRGALVKAMDSARKRRVTILERESTLQRNGPTPCACTSRDGHLTRCGKLD